MKEKIFIVKRNQLPKLQSIFKIPNNFNVSGKLNSISENEIQFILEGEENEINLYADYIRSNGVELD